MGNYYVTVAGAGDNSGDSWANAMAFSDLVTQLGTGLTAGDNIFIAGGTHSHSGSDITCSSNGTVDSPLSFIGVNSGTTNEPPVASDWATGDNRPLIDLSADATSRFSFSGYNWMWHNIRVSGQDVNALMTLGARCVVENCYVNNTYTGPYADGVSFTGTSRLINCECISGGDYGAVMGNDSHVLNCYFHDTDNGCSVGGGCSVVGSIFDTATDQGLYLSGADGVMVLNNTFYNCVNGLELAADPEGLTVINNTFSNCTNGFNSNNSGTVQNGSYFDYNNWYSNTHDMSWDNGSTEDNSAKGQNDIAADPQFTDASNGDFSLQTGSSLTGAGLGISLGVG